MAEVKLAEELERNAMRYEKEFKNLQLTEDTVLSIGKFDGLHRGHERLMDAVFKKTAAGLKAAVFTFDIPPQQTAKMLTTNEEKQRLFLERGVDYLVECPFTPEIMHMEAEHFIEELVKKLRVKCMAVGTDFRFGCQRRGDCRMLAQYAGVYGYEVVVVPKLQYGNRDISSTAIRDEICKGNIEPANEMLGHPYFIEGIVAHGNQIGRKLGFPTVNILPPEIKLLPPFGVYMSRVWIGGRCYNGVTNIGCKPTIHGGSPVGAETFILGFHENIYGKYIRVDILHFERSERKFAGLEELQEQLERDIQAGERYFAGRPD